MTKDDVLDKLFGEFCIGMSFRFSSFLHPHLPSTRRCDLSPTADKFGLLVYLIIWSLSREMIDRLPIVGPPPPYERLDTSF